MKPVIVADDNLTVKELNKKIIKMVSPRVRIDEVDNGRDLVERVRERDYAFVVTDDSMPKLTGSQAIGEIRKFNPDIPIILVSGTLSEREARESGATDYLRKPYEATTLMEVIQKYVGRNGD